MSHLYRHDILAAARDWIGTPYLHQASVKGAGCDCLGLIRGIWRDLYGVEPETPPPYSPDWAEAGGKETLLSAAQRHFAPIPIIEAGAGDLVLLRWRPALPAKHAGLLTGPDTLLHAHDGAAVTEIPLGLWRRRIAFSFRFPGVID